MRLLLVRMESVRCVYDFNPKPGLGIAGEGHRIFTNGRDRRERDDTEETKRRRSQRAILDDESKLLVP